MGEDREMFEKSKSKKELILIVITVLVVLTLTVLEANMASSVTKIPLLGNVLVFIIINLNILLILFLLFLVSRNFFKLFLERKRNILGSKIRYKLVVTFLVFSVIPMVLLFFLSYNLTRTSIKTYIGGSIGDGLESSIVVAREYISLQERIVKDYLESSRYVGDEEEVYGRERELGRGWSPDYLARKDFSGLTVLLGEEGSVPVGDFLDYISERPEGGVITHTQRNTVFGALKVSKDSYIIAATKIPDEIYSNLSKVSSALNAYGQARILTDPIRATNLAILIMITLIIIFTNTWIGFYLARDFSVPLKKLAEGTERLSEGREPAVIEHESNDEFGLLVGSFNKMAREIFQSRVELEKLNRELKDSYFELSAKAEVIEAIISTISTGVITLDKSGKVSTMNQVAKDILEISGGIEGQSYRELFSKSVYHVIRKEVGALTPDKRERTEKHVRVTLSGGKKELIVRATILKTAKKQYQGVVITIDDITDIKRLQQIMAWGEVARKVAHEIKNPLTPINLSAQRLKKKFFGQISEDSRIFEESVETIIAEVEVIRQLVDEFYRFARMPETKREEGNLTELSEKIMSNYKELYPDIDFSFEVKGDVPMLTFDQTKMKRVIVNLLENSLWAIRQRGEDGRIVLTVEAGEQKDLVKVSMEDNGIGIGKDNHEKIFDLYHSGKDGGKGLGLSIVKAIIDEHGGKVYSAEDVAEGARIVLEIPV